MLKSSSLALVVVLNLIITACGGGISGTGSGGPVIIVPPNANMETDGASTGDSVTSAPTADTGTSTSTTPTFSVAIPTTLIDAFGRNQAATKSAPFTEQFIKVSREISTTQNELATDQNFLITPIVSGYFDSSIELLNSANNIIVKWSSDLKTASLFSSNAERILYLLQEDQTITIRRFDRVSNSLFQATLYSLPENSDNAIIESVLNNNGELSYLRALDSNTTSPTALFIQHPTDTSTEQQRELISQTGAVTDVQTCTASSALSNCQSDEDWIVVAEGDSNANTFLTAAENRIKATLETASSPRNSLPQTTAAVIATTDIETPTAEQVQCGLQLVDGIVRAFCLQPQPLETNGSLFEEVLSGGEVFYQLLP